MRFCWSYLRTPTWLPPCLLWVTLILYLHFSFPGMFLCHYYYTYNNVSISNVYFLCLSNFIVMVLYCTYYYVTYFSSLLRFRHAFINLFNNYFIVWVTIYSLAGGVLFCFYKQGFSEHYCINPLYTCTWISLDYMSRSWMARSKEMNLFSFSGYCQTPLQSSCHNLSAYQ